MSEKKSVTFYMVSPDGEVRGMDRTIYFPCELVGNTAREREQRPIDAAKNMSFNGGSFTTSDEDQINFLSNYHVGGRLRNGIEFPAAGRNLWTITSEDPYAPKTKLTEVEVEKVVTKVMFPRVVLEGMTPENLLQLIGSQSLDVGKTPKTREALITFLEERGFVQ
jgi:hypothetical protein